MTDSPKAAKPFAMLTRKTPLKIRAASIAALQTIALSWCLLSPSQALAVPHLSIDLDSGKVLSSKEAFHPWHPASLTKLMTAYVIFRAIESGDITLTSPVRLTRNATRQPPSKIGYGRGTVMTMENALKLLIIKSANDIAVGLAESLSGSVSGFANRMNREAARLGMARTNFVNPHGLHNARQFTTAHDLARLTRALHREFPQYAYLFRAPSLIAPKKRKDGKTIQRVHFSYNLLLERFRGGDGFKTGFVCASGYNFIGSASQGGRRIAAIVLGRDGQVSRAVDAAKLIAEGFQQPVSAGTDIAELTPGETIPTSPRNMRPLICTKEARAKTYNPGAGQAVIESPWLQKRKIERDPIKFVLGGASGPISNALEPEPPARVPLPVFRPDLQLRGSSTLAANPVAEEKRASVQVKSIPLPVFRPGT